VAIYDLLLARLPSPVVRLNRAVALGMAQGPAAALPEVDALMQEAALARYHLLHAVRGDLLFKLGRMAEAREAFEQAASMTANERERALMRQRARATLS
jgi:predicted RNA polymerase sigma factor